MKEQKKKRSKYKQISSCITEKYNGFQTISIKFARKEGERFKPIDLIYKPTKNFEITPLCCFTHDISKAYINFYNVKDKTRRVHGGFECYYRRKFFLREDRHRRHIENCAGVSWVVYNFNTKNLICFQDKFYGKGHILFIFQFDFETAASTDHCFDPEQNKIFVVSYVVIVAFHPGLNLNRIIIQRSHVHSLKDLRTFNYLSEAQMKFIDLQILNQLKDVAINITKKVCKNTMDQIFFIETALLKKSASLV